MVPETIVLPLDDPVMPYTIRKKWLYFKHQFCVLTLANIDNNLIKCYKATNCSSQIILTKRETRMKTTYDLSWKEDSFFSKLALFFKSRKEQKEKMGSGNPGVRASGYSALSSTYYSIAGTAFAKVKEFEAPGVSLLRPFKLMLYCFTWLPLGAWCFWRMLSLSDHALALSGGYYSMSAEQCDIRQSILRRRGGYTAAKSCILIALENNPVNGHTRGLLQVGLADIYKREGDQERFDFAIANAKAAALQIEEEEPNQALRIYRHCHNLTGDEFYRAKVEKLIRKTGARDQALKSE